MNNRVPLNTWTFVSSLLPGEHLLLPNLLILFDVYIFKVFVSYYIAAVLAILPRTFLLRLAILPITLWLAFRAFTTIDAVGSDPGYGFLGYSLGVSVVQFTTFSGY